jgi:hypothetical protein
MFATPLGVLLTDKSGNPVAGDTVTFTVVPSSASGAGATFTSGSATATAVSNAQGIATAPSLFANNLAGAFTVTAQVATVTTSFALTNLPSPNGQLRVASIPATVTPGQSFSIQVDVEDSAGNLLTTNTSTVTLALAGPGSLTTGSASAQAVGGVATFSGMSIITPGSYAFTFSDGNLTGTIARLTVLPPGASYDPATQTLTISAVSFAFSQATTQDATGLHTTFTFTINGSPFSMPDTQVAHVNVSDPHGTGNAELHTADTYTGTDGQTHETKETVIIGNGAGQLYRVVGGTSALFLTLSGFTHTWAMAGHADSGEIVGTPGVQNFFVSSGGNAYMDSGSALYDVAGASSVFASAANANDAAYHYDGSGPSELIISGTAYSLMEGTDNALSYLNEAVGFHFNYGLAVHPTQVTVIIYDSPNNDVLDAEPGNGAVVNTTFMYSDDAAGNLQEFDQVQGFALINAYAFVGGTNFAYNHDPAQNHVSGFTVLS